MKEELTQSELSSFHFALAKGCFVVLTFVVDNLNILQ